MTTPPNSPEVIELTPPPGPARRGPWREGTFWLIGAAAMLFIGILKGINLVIVLAYVLAGLWVINLLLARRAVRGLSARRLPRAARPAAGGPGPGGGAGGGGDRGPRRRPAGRHLGAGGAGAGGGRRLAGRP